MLRPDHRTHLFEMLRPPSGWQLDHAIGTTFSLDLLTLLTLPLSFAFFDLQHPDGRPVADPLALLESLRRYGDRMTIFCQAAQIRLPVNYPALLTWLEPSIFEVLPRDERGVFHPKVWVLRFTRTDGSVRYRLLCLTRNLTFDRCWDTAIVLDGDYIDRENGIAANHPLADFIDELPNLAERTVESRRQIIASVSEELRRVRFELPEGFETYRFWHGGITGRRAQPFGGRKDETLILAPFVSDEIVRELSSSSRDGAHLVSRLETLQALEPATVRGCNRAYYLRPEVQTEEASEEREPEPGEVLDGLHTKVFVVDHGWNASVFSGSFNATVNAFVHNVEFMVELIGKKSRFGVREFLNQTSGETKFVDLLQTYEPGDTAAPPDLVGQQLDDLLHATKRSLAAAGAHLTVTAAESADVFDLLLEFRHQVRWPAKDIQARVWPISLPNNAGKNLSTETSLRFERLSYTALTPMFAFKVTVRADTRERNTTFVMNLPLEGAPADRRDRVMASLLENKEQLLRYILFLLAASDESSVNSTDLISLLTGADDNGHAAAKLPALFETMLRASHRDPSQLARVASVLEQLRRVPNSSALLTEEFQQIFEPIWEASQRCQPK